MAVSSDSKDQTACSGLDLDSVATKSDVNGDSFMPKVRKPYTIMKQRERWTEEEHVKFVEALKLYGRAWRQIEEHVGTKTAIQIRSHAQKFFAKVSRDSSVDADGSLVPIEIPPPRPKKKSLHPYPRKLVDSANTELIVSKKSCPLNESVAERENLSPTSVLSAIGSDTLEPTVAETLKSHASPTSCATDAHSADLLLTENDNEYVTSNMSAVEDDASCSSMKSSALVPDSKSNMKFVLFPKETESSMASRSPGEFHTSIKLFGKTVVVRDTSKQCLEVAKNSESFLPANIMVKSEINDDKFVQRFESNNSSSEVGFGIFSNTAYCPAGNIFAFPWCTLYQGAAFLHATSCSGTDSTSCSSTDSSCKQVKKKELKIGSLVESKNISSSGRGFVPYKRCLAERDDKSSVNLKREGQRARVCS